MVAGNLGSPLFWWRSIGQIPTLSRLLQEMDVTEARRRDGGEAKRVFQKLTPVLVDEANNH